MVKTFRGSFAFFIILSVAGCARVPIQGKSGNQLILHRPVSAGAPTENGFAYCFYTTSGNFIFGRVRQNELDVKTEVHAPSGKKIGDFDSSSGNSGTEFFSFDTQENGCYRVTVKASKVGHKGSFSLEIIRETPRASSFEDRVDEVLTAWQEEGAPGGAVAILKDGKVILKKYYGLASIEHQVPISEQTKFHSASLAKQFTGMAVALLITRGKIGYEDPVSKYLPDFSIFKRHDLKVYHLVHHINGIRDWFPLMSLASQNTDIISYDQILHLLRNQKDLSIKPQEKFLYSNMGYVSLAEIVSRVTGTPYEDWVRDNILKPLKMDDSLVISENYNLVPNLATGYTSKADGRFYSKRSDCVSKGSGTMAFTLNDFIKWSRNYHTHELGDAQVHELIHSTITMSDGRKGTYGFGEMQGEYTNGVKNFGHTGSGEGVKNAHLRIPDKKLSVIVLSNHNDTDRKAIPLKLANLLIGDGPLVENVQTPAVVKEEYIRAEARDLKKIAGSYFSPELNASFKIFLDEETLVAIFNDGKKCELSMLKQNLLKSSCWFMSEIEVLRKSRAIVGLSVSSSTARNVHFERHK